MMVNCDICQIVLSENDVPSHNKGKKHLKNLSKMSKAQLISNTKTEKTASDVDDAINKLTNAEKEAVAIKEESTPSNSKHKDSTLSSKSGDHPEKAKDAVTNKKNTKQPPEALKKRQKRKLKDDSPKPPSLPDLFINNQVSFDQQVIHFIRQVEQTQNEYTNITWVLRDVEYTFGRVIPGVKPVLYGSSMSGLAFKTSDIDVYLYDPRGGEPDRDFIQRDGSIIYRFRLFSNIVRIPSARVPVIKATHIETGIELDISATSGQAVANSKMLRFIISHDWRIRSLMMLIGYFGKKYTLIGVNKFSRYSINLLIIFYLQNLSPRILPPLSHIVYGSPGRTWPSQFKEHLYLLMNNNKQSLAEIFIGFFAFYENYNFSMNVISTYVGEGIKQEDIEKPEFLNKMIYYKKYLHKGGDKIVYRSICVQDPLELSHNTTKGITEKVLQQFKFVCTNALQIKEKIDEKNWLIEMLNMEHIPPFFDKIKENRVSFNVKYSYSGDDWITRIKDCFALIFTAFGMEIDWNCPILEDDTKKTKLSPGLSFGIETKKFVYPKGLKWCVNQLRLGHYNLKEFQKSLSEIMQPRNQSVFSAHCFVSQDQPNIVRITIKNNCTNRFFYNMIPILKNNFEILLDLALKEQPKD